MKQHPNRLVKAFLLVAMSLIICGNSVNAQQVSPDTLTEEKIKGYRAAAEQGNTWAMAALAEAYRLGQGVSKDMNTAVKWYQRSAEKGNVFSMLQLGIMYAKGTGVTKDQQRAYELFLKAAEARPDEARKILSPDSNEEIDKIIKDSVAKARYNLALMYYKGEGVQRSNEKARHWLSQSSKLGFRKASEALQKLRRTPSKGLLQLPADYYFNMTFVWLAWGLLPALLSLHVTTRKGRVDRAPWFVAVLFAGWIGIPFVYMLESQHELRGI